MDTFVYMMTVTAIALLDVLDLAFLLRAIFSWIPMEENAFTTVLHRITEPIIYPFRRLLSRLNLFQGFPLDMSFLFAIIVISLVRMGLSSLL